MKIEYLNDDSYIKIFRTDMPNKNNVTITKFDEFDCAVFFDGYEISRFINDLLSYESEKSKFNKDPNSKWDGRTRLFNPKNKRFPIGFKNMVIKALIGEGYIVSIDKRLKAIKYFTNEQDAFNQISSWGLKFQPFDHQIRALIKMINSGKCSILSITGSGKSFIIYLVIRYILGINHNNKILIVVPFAGLVDQMYKDLLSYETDYFMERQTHMMRSGIKKDFSKNVQISTYQTINSMDNKDRKKFLKSMNAVIVDEVHITGIDKSLKYCVNSLFRFGVTGTIEEFKYNIMRLIGFFGDIETISTYKELKSKGIVSRINVNAVKICFNDKVKNNFIEEIQSKINKFNEKCKIVNGNSTLPTDFIYRAERQFINEKTYKFMVLINLAVKLARMNRNVILLFQTDLDYQKLIYDMIDKIFEDFNKDVNLFTVNGSVKVNKREQIRNHLELSIGNILLANVVFSVGINIKRLDDLILCEIGKSKNFSLQSVGRIMRVDVGKNTGNVWDFTDNLPPIDDSSSYAHKHFVRRIKHYQNEGYNIRACKFDNINDNPNVDPLLEYFEINN